MCACGYLPIGLLQEVMRQKHALHGQYASAGAELRIFSVSDINSFYLK